jgi:hypothetical protein
MGIILFGNLKIRIALIVLISFTTNLNAQSWSGATPGHIFYTFGNVGIGTSIPNSKLHITGNSGWDTWTKLHITNGASDYGRTNLILLAECNLGMMPGILGATAAML